MPGEEIDDGEQLWIREPAGDGPFADLPSLLGTEYAVTAAKIVGVYAEVCCYLRNTAAPLVVSR
jgi:hypothetical protein